MNESRNHLTAGTTLTRNAALFFAGETIPLLVGIIALPYIIRAFGIERYGLLGLFWGAVSYLSLLDLGIGRALAREVSRLLATHQDSEILDTAKVAFFALSIIGILSAVPVVVFSSWLVEDVFNIPVSLLPESRWVFRLLAVLLPIFILTSAMQAILSAYQRFDLIAKTRVPFGLLIYIGPLIILPFTTNLIAVVAFTIATRVIAFLIFFRLCLKVMPKGVTSSYDLKRLFALLQTGGWLTVSNALLSIMVYIDRFLIGILASVAAVAFYVTPYDLVTKLLIIPSAIVETLFPAFSAAASQSGGRLTAIYERSTTYASLLLFPTIFVISMFAGEGLRLWLGAEFALQSSAILRLLAVGVFANGIAYIPYALLQGTSHSRLTAQLHVIECPLYIVLCVLLIKIYGATGAAIAWSTRAIVDCMLLLWFSNKATDAQGKLILQFTAKTLVIAMTCVAGTMLTDIYAKIFISLIVMGSYAAFSWKKLLDTREREYIAQSFKWLRT